MKNFFAIAAMLASLMLFGCKSEEPKQPATESTTKTMESSTTTAPAENKGEQVMEKTTETKTTETHEVPAPAETQK
ncbi:MAG: hypothetical protein KJ900_09945 [Proteobacteria bacterium]|nr:hypothetical protein [Desulfocapsa sp.]MBU3945397.1 hypothetical protein [Pseudomonadota bacterium]MCG2744149.1 hypothetical protein [Desulfobacteraceae bacterium]MBU4028151.1 hypothetical protein [Pseudomonadota bacterium]MBU4043201.1 hypothetical protein [Pseudomonadota bacterium]